MYDVYGSTVVLCKERYEVLSPLEKESLLTSLITKGYKKIFTRSRYHNEFRTVDLTWISPYKEPPFSTKFMHKEGDYLFYGDLTKAYYSPRYHYERQQIKELLEHYKGCSLVIIGSGISPYTVYLSDLFLITEVEPNVIAHHYGEVNLKLNNKPIPSWNPLYQGDLSEGVLSMVPSIEKQFHKRYNFTKFCIFYCLLDSAELQKYTEEIQLHYKKEIVVKKVRDYSKNISVYRFMLF